MGRPAETSFVNATSHSRALVWPVLLAAAIAAGCSSSTKVVKTWRDPAFKGQIDFKRTLVVAIEPDKYSRNATEDVLVERIGTRRAAAAHDVLTEQDRRPEQLLAKLPKTDFDGV